MAASSCGPGGGAVALQDVGRDAQGGRRAQGAGIVWRHRPGDLAHQFVDPARAPFALERRAGERRSPAALEVRAVALGTRFLVDDAALLGLRRREAGDRLLGDADLRPPDHAERTRQRGQREREIPHGIPLSPSCLTDASHAERPRTPGIDRTTVQNVRSDSRRRASVPRQSPRRRGRPCRRRPVASLPATGARRLRHLPPDGTRRRPAGTPPCPCRPAAASVARQHTDSLISWSATPASPTRPHRAREPCACRQINLATADHYSNHRSRTKVCTRPATPSVPCGAPDSTVTY